MKHPLALTLLAITEPGTKRIQPLQTLLEGLVGNVVHAHDLPSAFNALQTCGIDVVLFDLSLLHLTGEYSFRNLVTAAAAAPVILLARMEESNLAGELLRQGAQDCLVKGQFDADTLQRSIQFSRQRKAKENELLQANEMVRLIFNNSPLPTWVYEGSSLRFLEVNPAAIRTYGYSREEFLQMTGRDILPAGMAATLEEEVAAILNTGREYRCRTLHLRKDGEPMAVAVTAYPVDYFGQAAVLVQAQDITGEERLRRELEGSRRHKQQEIMEAVMKAEEKERTAIGYELHDNINQILASAKLYMETALRSGEEKDEYLRQGVHIIDVAIQEIRQLSKDLVATGFRHHGLVVAIQDITALITTARGIRFCLCAEGFDETALSEGHKLALYRMVQEQLNNVVKHARATEVHIELYTHDRQAVLRIRDNGRGFDTAMRAKGIGLSNIASRASFYQGAMEIRSAPGQGCELTVTLGLG